MVLIILYEIIKAIFVALWDLIVWIYLTLIPFMVKYIGIPLFIMGLLMGSAFSMGSFLVIIIFFIGAFFFIKGTVFHNPFSK